MDPIQSMLFQASSSTAAGEDTVSRDVPKTTLLKYVNNSFLLDPKLKKKLAREPPKPKPGRSFKKLKRESPSSHCKANNELEWVSKNSPHVKGTTLVEHVSYSAIHGDRVAEMDALLQNLTELHVVVEHTKECIFGQEHLDLMRLTCRNPGESSVTVGPVLQVESVRIYNTRNPLWDKFRIYGEITINDDKDNTFYIYKSQSNNADMVSPAYNYLYLECSSIAPVLRGNVCFRLTAEDPNGKVHRIPSFSGVIDLENSTEDKGVFTLNYYGYFVQMRFTKIPFAAICKVIMFLRHTPIEDEKEDVSTYGVYGTIKVNNAVSFDMDKDDPEEIICGKINGLGQIRIVYAVPVYSASDVKVELFSDGRLVFGRTVKLYPNILQGNEVRSFEFPSGQDKRLSFVMDVRWARYEDCFGCPLWSRYLNVKWNPNIAPIEQEYERAEVVETSMSPLVEVFSVYVGACDSSAAYPLALCGKVLVGDAHAENYIFVRNKDVPQKLSGGLSRNSVSLTWPSTDDGWILEKDFLMHLNLEDNHGR